MKEQTRKFKYALAALAATLVLCVAGFLIAGIGQLEVFKKLGPWGDFVGGTLNPILASATILALLYTIYLQRQANDLQKEELVLGRKDATRAANALEGQIEALNKQNFEATFFKMMEMHNSILDGINFTKIEMGAGLVNYHGRDCFVHFFQELLKRDFIENGGSSSSEGDVEQLNLLGAVNIEFWKKVLGELGHYYRHLYRLFRYVNEYNGDKHFYVKIVRAQLSDHELSLLFYNCLSEHGTKMKMLVEKYALLKHLPDNLFLDPSHKTLISPAAFVETEITPSSPPSRTDRG